MVSSNMNIIDLNDHNINYEYSFNDDEGHLKFFF